MVLGSKTLRLKNPLTALSTRRRSQALEIRVDTLESGEVLALLEEHLSEMHSISPPESVHALDPAALRKPEITFWSAWFGHELAGCGALKELSKEHGEIKSMRTSKQHRRKGVAAKILQHIIAEATRRGYQRLSLETGSMLAPISRSEPVLIVSREPSQQS